MKTGRVFYSFVAQKMVTSRKESTLTQKQAAEIIGISRSTLAGIETNQQKIELIYLAKAASVYKKDIAYFVPKTTIKKINIEPKYHFIVKSFKNASPKISKKMTDKEAKKFYIGYYSVNKIGDK